MKKQILSMSVMALLAVGLTFTGCKKTDTNAPTITLTGPASVDVVLGGTYTDQGATAEDKEDGNLTDKITNNAKDVNTKLAGKYTVTYTVADAAGNEASTTRTVNVKNAAEAYSGFYAAVKNYPDGTTSTYADTIYYSPTVNNDLQLSRLGNLRNAKVVIKIDGNFITFDPSAQTMNCGLDNASTKFELVTGTVATVSGKTVLTIEYNETLVATGDKTKYKVILSK